MFGDLATKVVLVFCKKNFFYRNNILDNVKYRPKINSLSLMYSLKVFKLTIILSESIGFQ